MLSEEVEDGVERGKSVDGQGGCGFRGLAWKGLNLRSGVDDQQKQTGMSPSAEADADQTGSNGGRETREL